MKSIKKRPCLLQAGLLMFSLIMPASLWAQVIDIGSFNDERSRAPLPTGTYGELRSALADPLNFGPDGIVPCTASVRDPTNEITTTYLADKDVFFTSVFTGDLTLNEQAAIYEFVMNGGVVIVDANSIPSEQTAANSILSALGTFASLGPGLQCENNFVDGGTISGTDTEVTNGPFGDIRGGDFGTSPTADSTLDGFFDVSVASCDSDIRAVFPSGALADGSGLVMYGGDPSAFDLFTTVQVNNLILYLNAFAAGCTPIEKELTSGQDSIPGTQIADGDFDSLKTNDLNGAAFRLGIDDFDEWFRLSPWQLYTPGASGDGADQYLRHNCCGGGDQRAFQVIDASQFEVGDTLQLKFKYIFEPGDIQTQGVFAGLVGIKDDETYLDDPPGGFIENPDPPRYEAYGGTGWDGYGFGPNINPDAVVLKTIALGPTTGSGQFGFDSLEATLDQDYDAIVVVLRGDAFDPDLVDPEDQGLRGFDDIKLFVDNHSPIDLAVEIKPDHPLRYDFTIHYAGPTEDVVIVDTLPAEWVATYVQGVEVNPPLDCGEAEEFENDSILLFRGGKSGKSCHSATQIWWDGLWGSLKIDAETRESPGKGHKETVYAPTSCGPLYVNEGAAAYPADVNGEPLLYEDPLWVSNALCIAAVYDKNGEGIVPDGTGNEDGDGLLDYEEACIIGTDPCDSDSDDDGVDDGIDNCPLEGLPDPEFGEILDPDGCIRQSQCSDGDDNDSDFVSDYPDDPSCFGIIDDLEDNDDEDGDGVLDGLDECPLDGDAGDGVDTNGCPNVACTLTQYFGDDPDPIYWIMVVGPTTFEVSGEVWGRSILESNAWPVTGSYDGTALDITGTNPSGDPVLCAQPGNQAEAINDLGTCDSSGVCTGLYTRICTNQDPTLTRDLDASFGGPCTL